jgi:hypothetical protein
VRDPERRSRPIHRPVSHAGPARHFHARATPREPLCIMISFRPKCAIPRHTAGSRPTAKHSPASTAGSRPTAKHSPGHRPHRGVPGGRPPGQILQAPAQLAGGQQAAFAAGVPGLEPRLTEPESVGLPITPYPKGHERPLAPVQFSRIGPAGQSRSPDTPGGPRRRSGRVRRRVSSANRAPCSAARAYAPGREGEATRTAAVIRGAR